MSNFVRRFERNTVGRDLIVGDIHGHFTKLQQALDAISFDPIKDRLFSVGDMVDRGPESEACLEWMVKPWFQAVCGNHERMSMEYHMGMIPAGMLAMNGGAWVIGKTVAERLPFVDAFSDLPVAIELETDGGLVGIVHADCPSPEWSMFTSRLAMGGDVAATAAEAAMWNRSRCDFSDSSGVNGVRVVVVGHTPFESMAVLGNVLYIDTMGWRGRDFTIIDAATLRPVAPSRDEVTA